MNARVAIVIATRINAPRARENADVCGTNNISFPGIHLALTVAEPLE
jgi:hypothetical protein